MVFDDLYCKFVLLVVHLVRDGSASDASVGQWDFYCLEPCDSCLVTHVLVGKWRRKGKNRRWGGLLLRIARESSRLPHCVLQMCAVIRSRQWLEKTNIFLTGVILSMTAL